MARLGAVLGGILAEITRARVISDRLTRDLFADYEEDPILASLSVPRVTIGGAEIVLRFTVSDFEEQPASDPDASGIRDRWLVHAKDTVLPSLLAEVGLDETARSEVIEAIGAETSNLVGRPRVTDIRAALKEDAGPAATATAKPLLDNWTAIPRGVRDKIGTKTTFRRTLSERLESELATFVNRVVAEETIQAALASRMEVAINHTQLSSEEPETLQEVRLSLSSQDLDTLLSGEG